MPHRISGGSVGCIRRDLFQASPSKPKLSATCTQRCASTSLGRDHDGFGHYGGSHCESQEK